MIEEDKRDALIKYRLEQAYETFEVRNQGDYDAFIDFSKDNVVQRLEHMRDFINAIEKHILQEDD